MTSEPDNILKFPGAKRPKQGNGGNGGNNGNGKPSRDLEIERRLTKLEAESPHYSTKAEMNKLIAQVANFETSLIKHMTIVTFGAMGLLLAAISIATALILHSLPSP